MYFFVPGSFHKVSGSGGSVRRGLNPKLGFRLKLFVFPGDGWIGGWKDGELGQDFMYLWDVHIYDNIINDVTKNWPVSHIKNYGLSPNKVKNSVLISRVVRKSLFGDFLNTIKLSHQRNFIEVTVYLHLRLTTRILLNDSTLVLDKIFLFWKRTQTKV